MTAKLKESIPVKTCYSHIGGKLGSLLLQHFIDKTWIDKSAEDSKHYILTPKGKKAMTELGIDLSEIPLEQYTVK